jgi:D-alanine-D-alanine ligase
MKEKILVMYGGLSSERAVSQKSGKAIAKGLVKAGFTVREFDFKGKIENTIEEFRPDLVFIALHGKFGEDGTVQGALELLGVPYTGSGVLASALCMDKLTTKRMFEVIDVNTPAYLHFRKGDPVRFDFVTEELHTEKVVIKPVDQGSTIGISIVNNEQDFKNGLNLAFSLSTDIIIEKFISGKEITVSIIGNGNEIRVLPIIEIVSEKSFYDFESKYTPGMSHHIIPARIPEKSYKTAEDMAYKIYREMGLRDFARIDFIVDSSGKVFALEANTVPGFTETSLLPDAAKAANIEFSELVSFIAEEAISRSK